MNITCPNCGERIQYAANVAEWLEPENWAFYGTVSVPVGEVDNPHGYAKTLRGGWETTTLKRAIRCKMPHAVHFYVEMPNGAISHRLAMIGETKWDDTNETKGHAASAKQWRSSNLFSPKRTGK